jgi:hypothetical protein
MQPPLPEPRPYLDRYCRLAAGGRGHEEVTEMARVVAGMASSHAFTCIEPEHWDRCRDFIGGRYAERYGHEPPVQPQVAAETLESNQARRRDPRRAALRERHPLAAEGAKPHAAGR